MAQPPPLVPLVLRRTAYPKLTVPVPVLDIHCATGFALLLVLHCPFLLNGPMKAKERVMFTEPVIPAYSSVPLIICTGALPFTEAEHVVASKSVG